MSNNTQLADSHKAGFSYGIRHVFIVNKWTMSSLNHNENKPYSAKHTCRTGVHKLCTVNINAAVNGHLELTLLKGRQRFDVVSTSNLEVYKFQDWWIFTYFIFGPGESSPNNIWSKVNLERTCVLLFYYFLYFKVNLDLQKQISLVNLHPTLFLRWWILTELF